MSSTYVDFQNRGFEANDATLEVWLALLVREIDQLDDVPDWLREVREEWHLQSTAGFDFGVMPGLDRYITDEDKRQAILKLARQALQRLERFGPVITRDQLNSLGTAREDSFFTADVASSEFTRPARYFIKLLEGTLQPSESDARFEPEK
jgi:hypothetical protein